MHYTLCLDNHPTIELALATFPEGVTSLYVYSHYSKHLTSAQVANIPRTVTLLYLKLALGFNDGPQLTELLGAIPENVTGLSLGSNYLSFQVKRKLPQALAILSENITELDLGMNQLNECTSAELAQVFKMIPASVTSLHLSRNGFGIMTQIHSLHESATFLSSAMAYTIINSFSERSPDSFPKRGVGYITDLSLAFAGINASVTSLNLSHNFLGQRPIADLLRAFAAIPATVTSINLKHNQLFLNKTRAEKDAIREALHLSNPNRTLNLSDNDDDESDLQRSIAPLACLAKKPPGNLNIPTEIFVHILSFLTSEHTPLPHINTAFLYAFNNINLPINTHNVISTTPGADLVITRASEQTTGFFSPNVREQEDRNIDSGEHAFRPPLI